MGAHLKWMRLSFHGCWTEDQSQLHISTLEIMAICFALKIFKAIQYIHHSCVMISTDKLYNSGLVYQQTRRNIFSQPMHRGMGNSPQVPGTQYCTQNSSYPRQIQYISRLSLEIGQTSQYRMVFGSIGGKFHFSHVQFSQCGFVCNSIQSQTQVVCISSSRQSSLSDRCIISKLEFSTFPPTIETDKRHI